MKGKLTDTGGENLIHGRFVKGTEKTNQEDV
jgi:hypothetical protein